MRKCERDLWLPFVCKLLEVDGVHALRAMSLCVGMLGGGTL